MSVSSQIPTQFPPPLTTGTANRRRFIVILPLAGAALLAACSKPGTPVSALPAAVPPADMPASTPSAMAAPAPVPAPSPAPTPTTATAPAPVSNTPGAGTASTVALDVADPLAKSLGYVADATSADTARFPVKVAGSHCANCAVYQGAAGSAQGACPIFGGRLVASSGWCSAWAKKA